MWIPEKEPIGPFSGLRMRLSGRVAGPRERFDQTDHYRGELEAQPGSFHWRIALAGSQ